MPCSTSMVGRNTQSTTARLVDRFRRATPLPRKERESNDEIWGENGCVEGKFWWKERRRGSSKGNAKTGDEKKAVLMRINKENSALIDQSEADNERTVKKNEPAFQAMMVEGSSKRSNNGDDSNGCNASRGEIKTKNEEEKENLNNNKKESLKSGEEYAPGKQAGDEEKEGALQMMNPVENIIITVRTSPQLSVIPTHLSPAFDNIPQHPKCDNDNALNCPTCPSPLVLEAAAAQQGYSDIAENNHCKNTLHVGDVDIHEQHPALEIMGQHVEDMIKGFKRRECELEVEKEESPSVIIEQMRTQLGLERVLLPFSSSTVGCLKRPLSPSFHNDSSRLLATAEDLIQDSLRIMGGRTEHVLPQSEQSFHSGEDVAALPPIQTALLKSEDGVSYHSHPEWGGLQADGENQLLHCHDFDRDPIVATLRKRMHQLQRQLKLQHFPHS